MAGGCFSFLGGQEAERGINQKEPQQLGACIDLLRPYEFNQDDPLHTTLRMKGTS